MSTPRIRLVTTLTALAVLGGTVACAAAPVDRPAAQVSPTSAAAATPEPATSDSANPGPGPTYIENLQYTPTSDPYDTRETANINGGSYPHSQGARFCFGDKDRKWEYNLGRRYDRFQATIGLDDNSDTATVVRYEVIGDGRTLYSQDVRFGMSYPVDLSVQNVLRLQLVSTLLSEKGSCGNAIAQWGEVRAVRSS